MTATRARSAKSRFKAKPAPADPPPRAESAPVSDAAALGFVEPMKAVLADGPPAQGEWIYELKLDGFRALVVKRGKQVQLFSRNTLDMREKFPEVPEAVAQLGARSATIDGEIIAVDDEGHSSFQLLQAFIRRRLEPSIVFVVFDLLELNGKDVTGLPLCDRKGLLKRLLGRRPPAGIQYSASLEGTPEGLLEDARAHGFEGLIAKRRDSTYEVGQRSGAWRKLKVVKEQEFVIGGWTDPQGARQRFGAILVGYYEGGQFKYAGKVGTGFDTDWLHRLADQFEGLAREDCPFVDLPEKRPDHPGMGITASVMRRFCHWVEPELVTQVKFAEWTRDVRLRQPVFLGLREDKPAHKVVREIPR